jgi:hypothetical protein
MATVADLAVNSLTEWKERDKTQVLEYIKDMERGLINLRKKIENGEDVSDDSTDGIISDMAHLRTYFIKFRTAYKAIRMINYHLREEEKIQAVPK